jgi:pyruvate dehydrogenase E2 component (dihydrolipoamide acetyltransferase)
VDIEIKAPAMGESGEDWTLSAWLKAVGEPLRAGDPIAEIMTEKVNVEVVSPASGVLQAQLVQVNDRGNEKTIIGIVRSS